MCIASCYLAIRFVRFPFVVISVVVLIAAFALLLTLAFVTNPELRILLMVVNALGLELVFFLIAVQLRSFSPTIRLALASARMWSCVAAFFSLRVILRACGALSPSLAPAMRR